MKKYLLGLAVLLLGTAVMTSCSDDNDGPETYLQEYSTGAYVVNSGNMYSKIESSLTAIDYASSTATQKVFKAANGRPLGDTANDGIVYGNKIYLAVDQSNTIEVIDKKTKRSIKQIKTTELLGNAEGVHPRHIIADGGKVYFTTYQPWTPQALLFRRSGRWAAILRAWSSVMAISTLPTATMVLVVATSLASIFPTTM